MKVLVLGGTGAMGVHLVNLIAQRAKRVVVTSRAKHGRIGNIEYITGNARDPAFLAQLLSESWDAIIDFMVYPTLEFQQRYPQFLRATGHYIYLSSARVYADSASPISEDSPRLLDVSRDQEYLASDEYALSKARQENLLFDSGTSNWTIVRPYITYSNERLQLGVQEKEDWLFRVLQGLTLVDAADIQRKRTTLTYGLDVARGINALVGAPAALGEAFHITADSAVSWSQVLDVYLDVLQTRLGHRPAVQLQSLDEFMRWRQGKYQILYDRLYHREFDNRKIRQLIDTTTFSAPLDGLAQCLQRFLESAPPQFRNINWRAEGIKGRLLDEQLPASVLPDWRSALKYYLFRHTPLAALLTRK